jgi:hypothetical protein
VAVLPGNLFVPSGSPPARVAYATRQSKVDEALAASRASRGGIEFYGYS